MKFGIIYCGYNSAEYVNDSLRNFIDRPDIVISAVSVPFEEYQKQPDYDDGTTDLLREYVFDRKIKYLTDSPKFVKESHARNLALKALEADKVDYYWLVDADEIYTKENIDAIIKYVDETRSLWYKICLKNFVFEKNVYIEEPFCPPRIFARVKSGYHNPQFYWDNDIEYDKVGFNIKFSYKNAPHKVIPKEVAWVDHYSWLNNDISRRKIEYQEARGWECSFKWEDTQLQFNDKYYKRQGLKIPSLLILKKTN